MIFAGKPNWVSDLEKKITSDANTVDGLPPVGKYLKEWLDRFEQTESWPISFEIFISKLPCQDDLDEAPADSLLRIDVELYLLSEKKREYLESGDHLSLLDAFYKSQEFGFTIPNWTIKPVSDNFREYINTGGKISLDLLFNVKTRRGRCNDLFSKRSNKLNTENLCSEIRLLNRAMGFSLDVAKHLVSMGIYNGKCRGYSTVDSIYKKFGADVKSYSDAVWNEVFKDRIVSYCDKYLLLREEHIQELKDKGCLEKYRKSVSKLIENMA